MTARPYVLLGASVLDQVRAALEAALAQWCGQWGVAPSVAQTTCTRACEVKAVQLAPAWRQLRRRDDAALYLGWSADLPAELERLLFAPDRQASESSALALAGAQQALAELAQALAGAPGMGACAPQEGSAAAELQGTGSGALAVQIRFGSAVCVCVLDDGAVRSVLALAGHRAPAPLPPLVPVHLPAALGQVALRVPVVIGAAAVELGSLVTLAVGDIVRLDSLVEQPLSISGPDGRRWFHGHLGTVEASLAIEIAGNVQSAAPS